MTPTRILLLGTGNAFNHGERHSTVFLVRPARGPGILVDAGPTVGLSLERSGVDTAEIGRVLFTHLHGDHIAGWPFLLLRLLFVERRTRPLDVWGPPGTRDRLGRLFDLCYGDILEREGTFEIRYHETGPGARGVDLGDGIAADTFAMEHHETSVGWLLRTGSATIGISGDTAWCAGVEELARASDLLILECTLETPGEARHVSLEEIREHAALWEGKRVVLVHLTPGVPEALAREPIEGVETATEGLVVEA